MKCPFCAYLEDKVVDSRESREGDAIHTVRRIGRLAQVARVGVDERDLPLEADGRALAVRERQVDGCGHHASPGEVPTGPVGAGSGLSSGSTTSTLCGARARWTTRRTWA